MGAKKVVIVKGSPRMEGNSAILADRVAAGAESVGAKVDVFYLHGMDIQPCDACEACHTNVEDECIVEDDMQVIYPKLREADALVIASPVYWFTVSAQTKLFMDRLRTSRRQSVATCARREENRHCSHLWRYGSF